MFTIDLRSSNVPISVALREHVARRLDFAVRRFAHRIERVTVRIVDINGPRGGCDKRCRIVARLSPTRTILVEAMDSDAYVAVSQATTRLEERVSRALTRRRPSTLAARRIARTNADAVAAAAAAPDEGGANEPA
jgi:ribosomal subunit interface protein